ncbi:hypothetical protein AB1Y20_002938 [Prymnesium parvum]|uniref:Cyclic nucleotide-binding domain-containing protein n=1 Tax=Prymnesium parvum TaxID=97485 RepID=A0AB34JCM6_PRYPA
MELLLKGCGRSPPSDAAGPSGSRSRIQELLPSTSPRLPSSWRENFPVFPHGCVLHSSDDRNGPMSLVLRRHLRQCVCWLSQVFQKMSVVPLQRGRTVRWTESSSAASTTPLRGMPSRGASRADMRRHVKRSGSSRRGQSNRSCTSDSSTESVNAVLVAIKMNERKDFFQSSLGINASLRAVKTFIDVDFAPGETLQLAGAPVTSILIIRSGTVSLQVRSAPRGNANDADAVSATPRSGKFVEIAQLGEGEIVGHEALLPSDQHRHTAADPSRSNGAERTSTELNGRRRRRSDRKALPSVAEQEFVRCDRAIFQLVTKGAVQACAITPQDLLSLPKSDKVPVLNICARRHAYHMQLLKAHSLADPSLYADSAPPSSSSGGEHTHATIAGRAAHACDAWVRRPLSGGANCADDDLQELLHSYLPQRAPGVDDLTRARRFDLPLTASAARMRPRSAQTAEAGLIAMEQDLLRHLPPRPPRSSHFQELSNPVSRQVVAEAKLPFRMASDFNANLQ